MYFLTIFQTICALDEIFFRQSVQSKSMGTQTRQGSRVLSEPSPTTDAARPLLQTEDYITAPSCTRKKLSILYGADEYLEELRKTFDAEREISEIRTFHPDSRVHDDINGHGPCRAQGNLTQESKSTKTGRCFPVPNLPDPMPIELAFMFAKITPNQMMYMWNILTLVFMIQCFMVLGYAGALAVWPDCWWSCTSVFGVPFAYMAIQNIYIIHDVMHGATFPPYFWQEYITHPFSDFLSLPWKEFVLEHSRHHASTVDLLQQGEFGWDPEEFQYWLLEWTWRYGKYPFPIHPCGLIPTASLLPIVHFLGLNDTGALFAFKWFFHFPDAAAGGKCSKEVWAKWLPQRIRHFLFVASLWACVWALGTFPLGRPFSEGWRFMLTVSCCARVGFSAGWIFITNFTHSHPWNHFLATDPERTWPRLHGMMAFILGGKHRWNEMLFHDLHHAFPNAVGTLSQRGRFHGWKRVHDAAVEILSRGLWKADGSQETTMQTIQSARVARMKIKTLSGK